MRDRLARDVVRRAAEAARDEDDVDERRLACVPTRRSRRSRRARPRSGGPTRRAARDGRASHEPFELGTSPETSSFPMVRIAAVELTRASEARRALRRPRRCARSHRSTRRGSRRESTVARPPFGDDRAAVEQHEPVGVLAGEREVVHRREDGQPVRAERVDELEHLLLAPEVERRRRLVEQEDRRLLRERAGEDGALELAAGERAEAALREAGADRAARARARPPAGRAAPRRRDSRDAACGRAARTPRP